MTNSIKFVVIFISLILLINIDLSSQLPNPLPSPPTPVTAVSSAVASPVSALASDTGNNIINAIENLRHLIIKQKEFVDAVVPIMIRAITDPVPGLAQALQRSLALAGVTSYLVAPTIARSARNLGPAVEPLVDLTDSFIHQPTTKLNQLFQQVMSILGLESEECLGAISCAAARQVATDYPLLASYLSQASTTLDVQSEKFARIIVEVMSSPSIQCSSLFSCPNLSTIEKYWKESGEKDLKTIIPEIFADSIKFNLIQ